MSELILKTLNAFSSEYLDITLEACDALYKMEIIPIIKSGKIIGFESEIK